MNQVGFDNILECPTVLANRCSQCFQSNRTTPEFFDQCREERAIEPVETGFIDIESTERKPGGIELDVSRIAVTHRREITNPTQQAVRNAWGAAGTTCDLVRRLRLEFDPKQAA